MRLGKSDRNSLRANGAKFSDDVVVVKPEPRPVPPEDFTSAHLKVVIDKLQTLIDKPMPQPQVIEPPVVNVSNPVVSRPRKWEHEVILGSDGRTKKIISTAID